MSKINTIKFIKMSLTLHAVLGQGRCTKALRNKSVPKDLITLTQTSKLLAGSYLIHQNEG